MVAIELPEDIAHEQIDIDHIDTPLEKIRRPVIDEKMFEKLVYELEKSKRPIILIGA